MTRDGAVELLSGRPPRTFVLVLGGTALCLGAALTRGGAATIVQEQQRVGELRAGERRRGPRCGGVRRGALRLNRGAGLITMRGNMWRIVDDPQDRSFESLRQLLLSCDHLDWRQTL